MMYIRRTIHIPHRFSFYEWWSEITGWSRDKLDATNLPHHIVPATLRSLRTQRTPETIQTIAVPYR